MGFLLSLLHNWFQLTFLAPCWFSLPISRGWKGLQFPQIICTLFRVIPRTEQKRKICSGSRTGFKRWGNPTFSKGWTYLQLWSEIRSPGHRIARTSFLAYRKKIFLGVDGSGECRGPNSIRCSFYISKTHQTKARPLQCVFGYVYVLWAFNTFNFLLTHNVTYYYWSSILQLIKKMQHAGLFLILSKKCSISGWKYSGVDKKSTFFTLVIWSLLLSHMSPPVTSLPPHSSPSTDLLALCSSHVRALEFSSPFLFLAN